MTSNNCVFSGCVVMLFISITLTQLNETYSTCAQTQCNRTQCPNPTECLHGLTEDDCQCCQVCLRQSGQPCGPYIGKCAKGLKCLSDQHLDPIITNVVTNDKHIGICGSLNCTGIKCDTSAYDHIKCQNDSYKLLITSSDSCCQSTCVCLPGICDKSSLKCPQNTIAQVVKAGNSRPGTCCDLIECIEAPTKCIHNNREYLNGEQWITDECSECECRDGITFCQRKKCKEIIECKDMTNTDDKCCSTCQGCISQKGKYYNSTQYWDENDCTHCQCIDGKIKCKVQMCSPVHCDNPIVMTGQCCPICSTQSTRSCDIQCPQGYKRNSFGDEICECIHCFNKTFECKMFCPFGFKRGSDGCAVCQCLTVMDYRNNKQWESKTGDNYCTLSNGSLISNGLYWHDSCRECFCLSGKVMCTKPNCPPSNCLNAVIVDHQCCPICTSDKNYEIDSTDNSSNPSHLHSHLFITAIILTLIITILLSGIFLLLAIFIMKKYPNFKYTRSGVINRSMAENSIILWPNDSSAQVQEKQFISIRAANNNNNLLNDNSLEIGDLEHSLQDKLLATG